MLETIHDQSRLSDDGKFGPNYVASLIASDLSTRSLTSCLKGSPMQEDGMNANGTIAGVSTKQTIGSTPEKEKVSNATAGGTVI